MNKTVTLPSGVKLDISLAPFAISRALYQAVLEEAKGLKLDPTAQVDANLYKDLFCTALSSKKIEAALEDCLKKVVYNGKRIESVSDVFEPVEARSDYFDVCFEVAKENLSPFMKNLYAQYGHILEALKKGQA